MTNLSFSERIAAFLSDIKMDYFAEFSKAKKNAAELDFGVLTVAMMVAALDGRIEPSEWAAFRRLADVSRTSAIEGGALWDSAVRAAGYILVQSQILTERQLILAFVREAAKALPEGFANGLPADVRRAFVMWVSMAMSDGEYSGVERKCINAFRGTMDASTLPSTAFMMKAAALLAANDMKELSALILRG